MDFQIHWVLNFFSLCGEEAGGFKKKSSKSIFFKKMVFSEKLID